MALPDVTTDRLQLTRWVAAAHTRTLAEINSLPAAVRYLNDGVPYTREETERQSARFEAHWEAHGFGLWAATIAASGRVIGFVGLAHPMWFPDMAHEVEVGWRLHPDAWGRGYATEAGRAALEAAPSQVGVDRVVAFIDPDNAPSIAVATRLGMAAEDSVPHPQRAGTLTIYAIAYPAGRPASETRSGRPEAAREQ